MAPDNHVPVTVPICCGPHIGTIRPIHVVHQFFGIDGVRIRMVTAEIFQWNGIGHGSLRCAEHFFDDRSRIGTANGMHGIESESEPAGKKGTDGIEIENRLHQFGIIRNGINYLNRHVLHSDRSGFSQIHIRRIGNFELTNLPGSRINGIRDFFRCRSAVADIVFDAEIAGKTAGIMARGKDNTAERPVFPDKAARCRRRQNAVLADHDLAETVGCRHFENDLYGNGIEKRPSPPRTRVLP